MIVFLESNEFWKLLLCLFGGAIGAFSLYFNSSFFSWKQRIGLAIFRFLSISILLLLLLSSNLRFSEDEYNPSIISLLIDNSSSLKSYEFEIINRVKKDIEFYEEKGFEVQLRTFGGALESIDSLRFKDRKSPLSEALIATKRFYSGQPLDRIVFYSDGIENVSGSIENVQLNERIDVVAVGDSIPKYDLKIDHVLHNSSVFKGNLITIRASISSQLPLHKKVTIQVVKENKVIVAEQVLFTGSSLTAELRFEAEKEGLQDYRVEVVDVEDQNKSNNRKLIFIEVLKEAQEILIVFGAPHPDIKMIKAIFEPIASIDITSSDIASVDLNELDKYQLIIYHGLPNISSLKKVRRMLKQPISRCFWLTKTSDLELVNQLSSGIKVHLLKGDLKVTPFLEKRSSVFEVSKNLQSLLFEAPQLDVPYGDYLSKFRSKVFLTQQVGGVHTDNVLVSLFSLDEFSEGTVVGEGYWKIRQYWQLYQNSSVPYDDFFKKYFQVLLKSKEENRFSVDFTKDVYQNGARPEVYVDIFNDLYQQVKGVDVSFDFRDKGGSVQRYNVLSGASTSYRFSEMKVGVYDYEAKAKFDGTVLTKRGSILIEDLNLEKASEVAQFDALRVLSYKHSGIFRKVDQDLIYTDKAKDEVSSVIDYREVIDYQLMFYILCFVLFVEWFFRKYLGSI